MDRLTDVVGTRPAGPDAPSGADLDTDAQRHVDRWLMWGCVVCGSAILGIPGLFLIANAVRLTRKAQREGRSLRPVMVTLIGVTCFVDACINVLVWTMDLFPTHDTVLGRTIYNGMGYLWDSGFYLHYNTTSMGGVSVASEKAWTVAALLTIYPMRMISAWACLKMKRWGFQWFLMTCYMFIFFWTGYIAQLALESDVRFGATAWGFTGMWLTYGIYLTSYILIPYLHTVNRELWTD